MATIDSGDIQDPVLAADSVAVVSDLHLGAENSVLGARGQLRRFRDFLEHFEIKVDAFILNGDMCDFALATMSETFSAAHGFLQVISDRCETAYYVPGNHDHHSWLLANEVHELLMPLPNVRPEVVERTERMYTSTFLRRLVDNSRRPEHDPFELMVAYPNLYWTPPSKPNATYIFSHGHFCEDIYSIVSDTLDAAFPGVARKDLEFLESVNFGWIEMIWYQLGQSGRGIGAHGLIDHLYAEIRAGNVAPIATGITNLYRARLQPVLHRFFSNVAAEHWWLPNIAANALERFIDENVASIVMKLISSYAEHKSSRDQEDSASSLRYASLDDNLAKHCDRYLARCKTSKFVKPDQELSLFFGHTHVAGKWPDEPKKRPYLFNDGGWITGPNGQWPDAHVQVIDARGSVTDYYFGPTTQSWRATQLTP